MDTLSTIYHFLSLSDRLATAGQPTELQLAAIAQAGYEVVINLALPTSDHALDNEKATIEALGLEYIAIPVQWEAPTLADLNQFFQAMVDHPDQRIFIHCAANMRVSAFVYLYRRLQLGVDETTALADLHKIWQPNERWQRFIEQALVAYSG